MKSTLVIRRLTGLALVALLVAACGTATSTPTPAPTPTGAPGATATDTAAATDTATATVGGPASTPAPRVAWVHGQTVKQDVLVSAGTGWVLTTTGLWQTIDDGVSWANAYPHSLIASKIRGLGAFDANHALLAVADVATTTTTYYLWHTANAGLTWAYTALPAMPHDDLTPCDACFSQLGDPLATFDYVDANTAFVSVGMLRGADGRINYIYQTTDGGVTWVPRSYDPTLLGSISTPPIRVQFSTATTGVAEFDNVISSTTSGWGHWTTRRLPTEDYGEPTVCFLSSTYWFADEGLAVGTVHYTYAISPDQGNSWVDHQSSVPGIALLTGATVRAITPLIWIGTERTSNSSGYHDGPATTVYTVDGGAHWAMYGTQPFNGSVATFVDADHGWAGPTAEAPTAKLYSTSDRGLTWRLLTP